MQGRSRLLSLSLVVGLALIALNPLPDSPSATAGGARPTQDPALRRLAEDLDKILSDRRLEGAQAGVVVRAASTGELLYSRNADVRLLPASNEKLLSAFAALEVLGPSYRFKTGALADGAQQGEALKGDLYLKGTGDPTMLAADYRELAAKVAATGIRIVEGGLVADDTWFDDVRLGPDWAWDDEPYAYGAQVSALTVSADEDFDAGSVIVDVAPGEAPGRPARVALTPATDYLTVLDRAVTVEAGATPSVAVDRSHGANTLVVTGTVPLGAAAIRSARSVWDPTGYAAAIFRDALLEHGVRVSGPTSRAAAPETSRELAHRESIPLSRLLVPFLKLSNNGHAEVLVKAMGRHVHGAGTWDAGLRA
ncbi:MAG: D-alanyl-D-alanine carboxypeptidase/D-alanyl-D-alanine endopeptidase, partial [Actinomycetota bacterium]